MDSAPILAGLEAVTSKWTKQRKAEERTFRARSRRQSMWQSRTTLKDLVLDALPTAWAEASDNGRLPTHWRQVFYRARPLVAAYGEADRPLTDTYFKSVLEDYLLAYQPDWDVLRGARGVFKEPHESDVVSMSTMAVRRYLAERVDLEIPQIKSAFPTSGSTNRFGAILICEKEGFDELLQAAEVPARYDLALMSTKGISALAARDLARSLGVPCFTLHDFDKNGFVMASGFRPDSIDIGIRLPDIEAWGLSAEEQLHPNPRSTRENLIRNGATRQEAEFIANGQRVELNELTGPRFIEFVESKLREHGVKKVIPDAGTLAIAWRRARLAHRINELVDEMQMQENQIEEAPEDLAERLAARLKDDPAEPWDGALWELFDDEGSS